MIIWLTENMRHKIDYMLLTKPATTKPPTVPWDPTEATANREITESCSCEIPVCWIRPCGPIGPLVTGLIAAGI